MAAMPQDPMTAGPLRVVLVDLDWPDADLLPALMQRPEVSVRLVAGDGAHDPGVRVAEMCGLPRTLDLADLTREIFDVALVGESSSRRTQLESLLLALGTRCQTPQEFLGGQAQPTTHGIEAPLALHAAAFEQSLNGGVLDAVLAEALPELTDPSPLTPSAPALFGPPRMLVADFGDFPSREARARLEEAIKALVEGSGAGTAELHTAEGGSLSLVAQVGPEDRLLRGLIDLAMELGTPQVVTRVSEPGKGKLWGAWPFRTTTRKGVLAAGAIDAGQDLGAWAHMVEDLRITWDEEDRERASAAFPFTPQREAGWLPVVDFRNRIELALERNRRDRMRFELHRLDLPDAPRAIDRLTAWLPSQLRDADRLCRVGERGLMLLIAGPPEAFLHLRRRLLALWDTAWKEEGGLGPAPALVDQHVPLHGPEDAEAFLSAAAVWLAPR